VDPSSRKMKIGTRLFEKLLQDLDQRGVHSFLTVDPLNENALGLYTKWGFEKRGFKKGYYRKNEDRLVLKRKPSAKA
jgi:ribosomal protein S18 acetylase RimI-like enzyme